MKLQEFEDACYFKVDTNNYWFISRFSLSPQKYNFKNAKIFKFVDHLNSHFVLYSLTERNEVFFIK